MQVTFQTDYKDYQSFECAVKALPLRGLVPFVFLVVCLEIAAALSNSDLQMRVELLGWRALIPQLWLLAGTLTFFGVIAVVSLELHKARVKKAPFLNEPTSIETSEEGISGASSRGREAFFWPALHRIIETETHFFVLSAPKYGFIIPKRAFDSPAQCAEFGALLQRKWAEHHPDAAPIAPAK